MAPPGSHLRSVPSEGSHPAPAQAAAGATSVAEQTLELVQRAQAQMNAWSKLYQDNFERIYRHVRALTGDPHVSEELVQETFVQALLRISSFDRPGLRRPELRLPTGPAHLGGGELQLGLEVSVSLPVGRRARKPRAATSVAAGPRLR